MTTSVGGSNMDTRQLNYFISVAEHLNFTKAAEHYYISQTAISQQIKSLEQDLGVKLFYRDNRNVRLTPAGKVLYKEAKFLVAKAEEAKLKTIKADSGIEGSLKIGFLGPNEKEFLPNLLRKFKSDYPGIEVTLFQDNMGKLHEALNHELLDLAFTTTYGLNLLPDISKKTLLIEPWCAIVSRNHPLANESTIRRSVLANESFICLDREEASSAFDALIQRCIDCGFSPKIVCTCRSMEALLMMVEAEIGIALFRRSIENYAHNNLRFIDLEGDNEYSEYVLIWKSYNSNPAIPLFQKVVEKYFTNTKPTLT